jgi:hypothetical protein
MVMGKNPPEGFCELIDDGVDSEFIPTDAFVYPVGYMVNPYLTSTECPHPLMQKAWDEYVKKNGDGFKEIK